MELETTLDALAPRLLRYCLGLARNHAMAEDAAQEALAALIGRWQHHGPPENAAAFAFTVARRRLKRRLWRARLFRPLEAIAGRADEGPDPESRSIRDRHLDATLDALDRLSRAEREAILLTAAGELSTAEAAAQLGIGHSALKMRVHRARQNLRRQLEDEP